MPPKSFTVSGNIVDVIHRRMFQGTIQIENGKIAAIYFDAGTAYIEHKTFVVRDFVNEVINRLYTDKIAEVTGSHLVHVAVNRLNDKLYVNLINSSGEHNGQNVIGYDEIPVIKDLEVILKTDSKPSSLVLQPEGTKLKFRYSDGKVNVIIPQLSIHSVIEVK